MLAYCKRVRTVIAATAYYTQSANAECAPQTLACTLLHPCSQQTSSCPVFNLSEPGQNLIGLVWGPINCTIINLSTALSRAEPEPYRSFPYAETHHNFTWRSTTVNITNILDAIDDGMIASMLFFCIAKLVILKLAADKRRCSIIVAYYHDLASSEVREYTICRVDTVAQQGILFLNKLTPASVKQGSLRHRPEHTHHIQTLGTSANLA
jgi:hypothetical protein